MTALLELDSVSQAYGATTVVEAMSFALQKGEIACLGGQLGLRQDHGAALHRRFRAGEWR